MNTKINLKDFSVDELKELIESAKVELKTRRVETVEANHAAKENRAEAFSKPGAITEGSVIRFLFNKQPIEATALKVNGKSVTVEIEGKNGAVAKKYIKYENILAIVSKADEAVEVDA